MLILQNFNNYEFVNELKTITLPTSKIDPTTFEYTAAYDQLRIIIQFQTPGSSFTLRQVTVSAISECAEVVYNNFLVKPKEEFYALAVTPENPTWNVGQNFWRSSQQVRTTFQDANWLPNGVKFSTHDQENDDTIVQCNSLGDNGKSSGWWYKSSAQKFYENKIGKADVIGNFEVILL